MDYFRTDCIKSYFELVAFVNKGNRVINEQTEARFFIIADRLFLGIDPTQKVLLCKRPNYWFPENSTAHEKFEKFVCRVLNTNKIVSGDVDRLIKSQLFKAFDEL